MSVDPDAISDLYLNVWDPRKYLAQYYADTRISEDERANFGFAARHLGSSGRRFARAVEVGCGPTLHHAFVLAPHVDELYLADFLPENLEEVRRSLAGEPGAHDWGVFLDGITQTCPGTDGAELWSTTKARVAGLLEANVRLSRPLATEVNFDLVASYYCIECVSGEKAAWRGFLANVSGLVEPGGVLLLGSLRRSSQYHILDRTFPTASVDESDFEAELPSLGFDPATIVIEIVSVPEWADQGFDSICCVWAQKFDKS